MIKLLHLQARARDRSLARDGPQFLRRKIFQLAAIASKGRACPAHNRDITRFQHDFPARSRAQSGSKMTSKLVSVAARERI